MYTSRSDCTSDNNIINKSYYTPHETSSITTTLYILHSLHKSTVHTHSHDSRHTTRRQCIALIVIHSCLSIAWTGGSHTSRLLSNLQAEMSAHLHPIHTRLRATASNSCMCDLRLMLSTFPQPEPLGLGFRIRAAVIRRAAFFNCWLG